MYDKVDRDTPEWAGYTSKWYALFPEIAKTVSQLVEAMQNGPDSGFGDSLPEYLAGSPGTIV